MQGIRKLHRHFFDRVAKSLGIQSQEDWYSVSREEVRLRGGAGILVWHYSDSLYFGLKCVYPEFEWNPLLFENVPQGIWKQLEKQREVFDWVSQELNIQTQEDWYNVSVSQLHKMGVGGLLTSQYNSTLLTALCSIYPQFDWDVHKFNQVPLNFWKHRENHRVMFDRLAEEFGIQTQEDWYKISGEEIKGKKGASSLLCHYYSNSLSTALQKIYPEYEWLPWLFQNVPKNYFTDTEKQQKCLNWVGEKLGIKDMREWLHTPKEEVKRHGGASLLLHYKNSYFKTLLGVFHHYDWKTALCISEGQNHVHQILRSLVKDEVILVNHKIFRSSTDQHPLELDLYVPSLSLAIEYQGEVHYDARYFTGGSSRHRDKFKMELCEQRGITLVQIPYWWHCSTESLASTIVKARPDLETKLRRECTTPNVMLLEGGIEMANNLI